MWRSRGENNQIIHISQGRIFNDIYDSLIGNQEILGGSVESDIFQHHQMEIVSLCFPSGTNQTMQNQYCIINEAQRINLAKPLGFLSRISPGSGELLQIDVAWRKGVFPLEDTHVDQGSFVVEVGPGRVTLALIWPALVCASLNNAESITGFHYEKLSRGQMRTQAALCLCWVSLKPCVCSKVKISNAAELFILYVDIIHRLVCSLQAYKYGWDKSAEETDIPLFD